MSTSRRVSGRIIATVLSVAFLAIPGFSQSTNKAALTPPAPRAAQAPAAEPPAAPPNPAELRARGLAPEPVVAEALGLTLHAPRGTTVSAENINGRPVLTIADDAAMPTWTMRIQSMTSTHLEPSPQAHIDILLKNYEANKETYRILSNDAVRFGGRDGRLCYVERTSPGGERFISGWLMLPNGVNTFLVAAIQTLPEHFEGLKRSLNASFETLVLKSAEEVSGERYARLSRARDMLALFTPDRLKTLAGQKQWSRIYRPDARGTTEIGYALIEVLEGKRGAVEPGREEKNYTPIEHELGLLVRVQGRVVVDAARKIFYDSIAIYWMAWDQSEEVWNVRGTHRQGDAEQSEAETGLRSPQRQTDEPPMLTVIKTTTTSDPVRNEWEVPNVYLSQALGWIVGRLLPRDSAQTHEYAWYFYVSSDRQPKVYQRLDEWKPTGDGSGNFTLTTTISPNAPPFVSTYGHDGAFIRRTKADGSITEPIELEELRRIWKAKGLPVGPSDR